MQLPARDLRLMRNGGELGISLDVALQLQPSNPVDAGFRKPNVAIRAARDALRLGAGTQSRGEFGHDAGRGDSADSIAQGLGEP